MSHLSVQYANPTFFSQVVVHLQVLRVYHDKRQRRLTRFDRVLDAGNRIQPHQGTPTLSPKKRKRPARRKSSKHAEAGTEFGQPQALSQIVKFPEDDGVGRAFLDKYGLSRAKPTCSGRFCWTDVDSSKSPLVPTLLAETLRRYSEHDLFAAFNYLRDKKFLIGGHSNSPSVLSQTFLNGIEFSPFPSDTGKRAAKFVSWLCEREKELIAEGVDLPTDLQCGDVYHLCVLLSSGELSITPCLPVPDEGVGEAEDSRTSKCKYDDSEFSDSDRYKKLKTSMGGDREICTFRAKGFPGIRLCLRHATLSRIKTMDLFKDTDNCTRALPVEEHQATDHGSVSFDSDDQVNELNDSGVPYTAVSPTESPWQAMTTYAERVCSFGSCLEQNSLVYPEMFRSAYSAIQRAADRGLCMKDISRIPKILVAAIHKDVPLSSTKDSEAKIDEESATHNREDHKDVELQMEIRGNSDKVHKVTILNLPKVVAEPSSEKQTINETKGCQTTEASSPTRNHQEEPMSFALLVRICVNQCCLG
ncbi:putative pentatricopeptide repeat-containing protein-like [Capsicum annuum]